MATHTLGIQIIVVHSPPDEVDTDAPNIRARWQIAETAADKVRALILDKIHADRLCSLVIGDKSSMDAH